MKHYNLIKLIHFEGLEKIFWAFWRDTDHFKSGVDYFGLIRRDFSRKPAFEAYKKINLTLPLKQSLDKKKLFMQKAVRYFGQASAYGIAETATQAKHRIAEIYQMFSHALLNSQRPKGLSVDEREQYNILLEDQAFPFEEKAIEFFEANLSHAKDGIYDDWVRLSHSQLKLLFPGRYQRETKTDAYINVLH